MPVYFLGEILRQNLKLITRLQARLLGVVQPELTTAE